MIGYGAQRGAYYLNDELYPNGLTIATMKWEH